MALRQVAASVQNDGNYCQLDLQDTDFRGPLMRIETFRCSQPAGEHGVTQAGTRVEDLAGNDHLKEHSNRTFRHVFSVQSGNQQKVTLEIREVFTTEGAWEIRGRDLDPASASFGSVLAIQVEPTGPDAYRLQYEVRKPRGELRPVLVASPLSKPVTSLVPGLADIGAPLDELGPVDRSLRSNPLAGMIGRRSGRADVNSFFQDFASNFDREHLARWAKNVQVYERFGDFRDKCVHPGTNLTGPFKDLASEYILIRAYRGSLITMGRVCDPAMSQYPPDPWTLDQPLALDPKPGVYAPFLSAYVVGIPIYQLGIDKVHSDYGGIPMALSPGSKLENGRMPIVDSTRANITLAELAVLYYVGWDALRSRMSQLLPTHVSTVP